jgi:predicted RNase H-like nuclease
MEGLHHVGVDGCRAGWIAVTRSRGRLQHALFSTMRELMAAYEDAERILVDIPIGLPWNGVATRPCDRLARSVLGAPRRSSVFPVPCREAVQATNLAQARVVNAAVLGRSLSRQTWGICGKIAEVDALLLEDPPRSGTLREIHPEVCFWALAGRRPMRYEKSTPVGQNERLDLLARHEPQAATLLGLALSQSRRADVQADDVLDAIAAFVTAEAPDARLARLTGEPCRDQQGLPMEMVYAPTR